MTNQYDLFFHINTNKAMLQAGLPELQRWINTRDPSKDSSTSMDPGCITDIKEAIKNKQIAIRGHAWARQLLEELQNYANEYVQKLTTSNPQFNIDFADLQHPGQELGESIWNANVEWFMDDLIKCISDHYADTMIPRSGQEPLHYLVKMYTLIDLCERSLLYFKTKEHAAHDTWIQNEDCNIATVQRAIDDIMTEISDINE